MRRSVLYTPSHSPPQLQFQVAMLQCKFRISHSTLQHCEKGTDTSFSWTVSQLPFIGLGVDFMVSLFLGKPWRVNIDSCLFRFNSSRRNVLKVNREWHQFFSRISSTNSSFSPSVLFQGCCHWNLIDTDDAALFPVPFLFVPSIKNKTSNKSLFRNCPLPSGHPPKQRLTCLIWPNPFHNPIASLVTSPCQFDVQEHVRYLLSLNFCDRMQLQQWHDPNMHGVSHLHAYMASGSFRIWHVKHSQHVLTLVNVW